MQVCLSVCIQAPKKGCLYALVYGTQCLDCIADCLTGSTKLDWFVHLNWHTADEMLWKRNAAKRNCTHTNAVGNVMHKSKPH